MPTVSKVLLTAVVAPALLTHPELQDQHLPRAETDRERGTDRERERE